MNKRIFLSSLIGLLSAGAALAQPAGDAPIRIIVPLGSGTPSDSASRIVANGLSELLKRPVIVDNKPGAEGRIAVQELLKSKPDGTTLMLGGVSPVAINMALMKNPGYDSRRDFTAIGGIYRAFQVYMVNSALPVNTMSEFIAYAKRNPGKLSAAHYSALTKIQVTALNNVAEIDTLLVPYKTTSSTYTDLASGVVNFSIADYSTAMSLVSTGKVKPLAITLPERSPLSPNLPTSAETLKGFSFPAWSGLIGPAHMAPETVAKLNAAL
ncbi:MAG: hypothetical protein RLZZ371_1822, partial [Pseudomonadota bacterium]